MSAAAPGPSLLRERWGIIGGIAAVSLAARCGVILAAPLVGGTIDRELLIGGLWANLALLLPMPVLISVMQRSMRWVTQLACAIVYFAVTAALMAMLFLINSPPGIELPEAWPALLTPILPSAIIFYFTVLAIVRALRWYRAALAMEAQRRELESAEVHRTRRLVERRFRPATISATLTRIERILPEQVDAADALVHQLARYARLLLRTPVSDSASTAVVDELERRLEESGVKVQGAGRQGEEEAVSCALRPAPCALVLEEPRSLFLTLLLMVVTYGVTSTVLDTRDAEWNAYLPLARMISVCAFVVAGPILGWLMIRAARLRLPAALAAGTLLAIVAGTVVATLARFGADRISGPQPGMEQFNTVLLLTRNILIALALAAITFAHAISRALLTKETETAQYRDEVALAETRELEARFHPHFLFNALTSIAALIRSDPAAAAIMCRRLSDLVQQIVASAGIHRWALRTELDLAADYMAVQRMRFGDRIWVESWDVAPGAYKAIVPRLLLQPLLENAFKHGVARHGDKTAVGLSVKKRGRRLSFDLWNDAPGAGAGVAFGRGLAFVHRSVEAAGGELTVDTGTIGRFAVHCSIPQ